METETPMTTAKVLASYRTELIEGGFSTDAADLMARDAATFLLQDGLGVRDA